MAKTNNLARRITALLIALALFVPLLPLSAREVKAYTTKAKYAVSLYGVENRSVEVDGETVVLEQLTFGPALGANYLQSYKDHTPSGSTDKGNPHRCLHGDSWEKIIHWNDTDPHVYDQCITNGCTHSVELDIPTELQGTLSDSALAAATGDGPSVLYNELATGARYWKGSGSYVAMNPGWESTNLRAMLNGVDGKTATSNWTYNNDITSDKALISAFPSILQEHSAAKRVKYDSVYNAKTEANLKTTYDKLWLFSPNEIGLASSVSSYYQHPLEADGVYDIFTGQSLTTNSNNFYRGYCNSGGSGSTNYWWLRSSYSRISDYALCVYGDGNVNGGSTNNAYGVAPGFTLQSPLVRTITYDANGGVNSLDTFVSYINSAGGPIHLEGAAGTPTREGYAFAGWYYDTRGARAFDFNSWDGSEDITVYAKWEPVKVKYAVAIYGIRQDTVLYEGEETTSGLTFGPATGANYIDSYKSHTTTGQTTDGHDHRCVHNDNWPTIVLWNYLDPYVYEQCVEEGCTHSVEIVIPDVLRGTLSTEAINAVTGDGPSMLYNELTTGVRYWKGSGSTGVDTDPGWESTNLRAVLNSIDDKTTSPNWALTNNITPSNALFSGFPDILKEEIAPKKVIYDSKYNSVVISDQKVTYDKLWLLSQWELGLTTYLRSQEGVRYANATKQAGSRVGYYKTASGSSTHNWWLRSSYRDNIDYAISVSNIGILSREMTNYTYGVAPGFTLASPSDTGAAKVALDAQGGYTAQSVLVPTSSSEESGTVPTAERPGYELVAWTENADGTGASYQPGDFIAFPTSGTKWLYAQWTEDTRVEYAVKHYQQTADLSGYTLVDTEYIKAHPNDSVTPETKSYAGFISPSTQTTTVADDWSTVVEYRYDRTQYKIRFDGNGATSGYMEDQDMIGALAANLATNTYHKKGSIFQGWNTAADGSGTSYTDAQSVINLTTENNGTVTLYAQWLSNEDAELSPTNGVIYVQVKAGETAVIPDLPAGTTYTIEEVDNPDGWSLSGYVNEGGTISANTTTNAQVNNRYHADGMAYITAHKRMNDASLSAGDFSFELYDSSNMLLQTKTNGDVDINEEIVGENDENMANPWVNTAPVEFDPLQFSQEDIGKTFTYTIKEVNTNNPEIIYDSHVETVQIKVTDAGGGNLACEVIYDTNGPLFTNSMQDGSLQVRKTIINATDAAKDTEFGFTINLKDANGDPLTDAYPAKIKHADYHYDVIHIEDTKIVHTPNITDDGTRTGGFGPNLRQKDVVTIPGATKLHVDVRYGTYSSSTSYGRLWITEGEYSGDVTTTVPSPRVAYLYGYTSPYRTAQYDIDGDTATFGFYSGANTSYNSHATNGYGYGYYAVVTANEDVVDEGGYTDTVISNGSTISFKATDTLEITGLPHGSTYEIIETDAPGWEQTNASNATGVIVAGTTQTAEFTNTYSTVGSFDPSAEKVFYGGDLADRTFDFILTDENGTVLRNGTSDESGNVSFTPIDYDQQDDGKRYSYYIREVAGEDENITWDEHVAEIIVDIADNGAGELIVTPTVNAQDLTFTNVQTGQIEVSKTVAGSMGDKSREFAFTLKLTGDWDKHPITYTKTLADGTETSGTAEFTSGLLGGGSYAFTLSHGDTITFDGITDGVGYDIVENDANEDAYTTTAEGSGDVSTDPIDKEVHAQGTLDASANAAFTNTRDVAVPTNTRMPWYGWALLPVVLAGAILLVVKLKDRKNQ